MPAWPPSSGTGCGPPPRPTAPRPAAPPAPRPAKPPATGRDEPPRTTLRRHVSTAAASAASAEEFFARLDQAGVLVRLRYSTRNPGQVTGYAVALPGDTARNGEPVWYGGGKLAADLSWPRLAQRWTRPARPDSPLTPGEADALWEYAARTAADATARIRYYTATGNPAAAADAASAASDALHVAAAALGSRALRRAADDYDRAARQPYGRVPAPTPAGNQLRHAARLISAYAYLTGDRTLTPVVLLVRLAALAEAVAELRESQQRAAQAAAALRAARHLRTATRPARHPAARQARHGHHTTGSETRAAPPGHRRRPGPAQLPQPAPAPSARTRPARTPPGRPAATTTTATTATRPHPVKPRAAQQHPARLGQVGRRGQHSQASFCRPSLPRAHENLMICVISPGSPPVHHPADLPGQAPVDTGGDPARHEQDLGQSSLDIPCDWPLARVWPFTFAAGRRHLG